MNNTCAHVGLYVADKVTTVVISGLQRYACGGRGDDNDDDDADAGI